jgi:hypothetical protein
MTVLFPDQDIVSKKSLLASLCEREEFPLFGKEGLGEILEE